MNQTKSTVEELVLYGKRFLKNCQIETYILDAELLLCDIIKFTRIQLITKNNHIIYETDVKKYLFHLERRKKNEPVQYIINHCEFMGLDFYVDKNVLIPRSDTEILVEKINEFIKKNKYKKILEIGTGSGCISISLAYFNENIKIKALDISPEALEIANKNAVNNDVFHNISFVESDLFSNIQEKFDVIISNPPYIKKNVICTLAPNVKDFEPHLALDGGENGLDFYLKIIQNSKKYLNKNGMIFFEIGYDQAEDVKKIFIKNSFTSIEIIKDYAKNDRVVFAKIDTQE